jgi:hypothetical protein
VSAGNYAVPGASRYKQVNTNPWMQALKGYTQGQTVEMNWSPYMGLEAFLQQSNPSQSGGATIRSMYDMMQQRYGLQSFNAMAKGEQNPNWVDYLKDFDYGREFARLTPATRREQPQKFMRPVRTVTY